MAQGVKFTLGFGFTFHVLCLSFNGIHGLLGWLYFSHYLYQPTHWVSYHIWKKIFYLPHPTLPQKQMQISENKPLYSLILTYCNRKITSIEWFIKIQWVFCWKQGIGLLLKGLGKCFWVRLFLFKFRVECVEFGLNGRNS